MTNYFDQEVSFFHENVNSQTEVFKKLADTLESKGLVKVDFLPNIIKREENFPTGLNINGIGVAIPHTDSEYVERSQVAFMSLVEPITFYEMGSQDKEVPVQLIFMLALKKAHEQLDMLQNLMAMFQKEGVLQRLLELEDKESYKAILEENNLI